MKINSVEELAASIGTAHNTIESISRAIYKGTDCGAWVDARTVDDKPGIGVGSIVEGVERTTETQELAFPFSDKQFWSAVAQVEKEAGEIWNETHGCEACGDEDPESGYRMVNPSCKECGGSGQVF